MVTILVAEDDTNTRKLMGAVLKRAGYDVLLARNGDEALDLLDTHHVDLLVTDVMMPGTDGFALTQALRDARYDLPILMVTAKSAVADRRQGFLVGTDDYVTKPVDAQELVLRVRALLRRAHIVAEHKIEVGDAVLDYDALTVSRPGEAQTLPPKEFFLLYKLLAYPGQVFTRLQLLDEVWGQDSDSDPATVSVHVNRLRTRFAGWDEFQIQTVRGIGYKAVRNDG